MTKSILHRDFSRFQCIIKQHHHSHKWYKKPSEIQSLRGLFLALVCSCLLHRTSLITHKFFYTIFTPFRWGDAWRYVEKYSPQIFEDACTVGIHRILCKSIDIRNKTRLFQCQASYMIVLLYVLLRLSVFRFVFRLLRCFDLMFARSVPVSAGRVEKKTSACGPLREMSTILHFNYTTACSFTQASKWRFLLPIFLWSIPRDKETADCPDARRHPPEGSSSDTATGTAAQWNCCACDCVMTVRLTGAVFEKRGQDYLPKVSSTGTMASAEEIPATSAAE